MVNSEGPQNPNKDKEEIARKLRKKFEDQINIGELPIELRYKRYSI